MVQSTRLLDLTPRPRPNHHNTGKWHAALAEKGRGLQTGSAVSSSLTNQLGQYLHCVTIAALGPAHTRLPAAVTRRRNYDYLLRIMALGFGSVKYTMLAGTGWCGATY